VSAPTFQLIVWGRCAKAAWDHTAAAATPTVNAVSRFVIFDPPSLAVRGPDPGRSGHARLKRQRLRLPAPARPDALAFDVFRAGLDPFDFDRFETFDDFSDFRGFAFARRARFFVFFAAAWRVAFAFFVGRFGREDVVTSAAE
jgi:hypothetical protein